MQQVMRVLDACQEFDEIHQRRFPDARGHQRALAYFPLPGLRLRLYLGIEFPGFIP